MQEDIRQNCLFKKLTGADISFRLLTNYSNKVKNLSSCLLSIVYFYKNPPPIPNKKRLALTKTHIKSTNLEHILNYKKIKILVFLKKTNLCALFLPQRIFVLLSSFSSLYSQRFNRYVLRPSLRVEIWTLHRTSN